MSPSCSFYPLTPHWDTEKSLSVSLRRPYFCLCLLLWHINLLPKALNLTLKYKGLKSEMGLGLGEKENVDINTVMSSYVTGFERAEHGNS